MRFNLRPWGRLTAALVIAGLAFTPMTASAGQAGHRGGGGGSSSGNGGGHQPSGGGERVGTATPRSDGGSRSGGDTGSTGGGSGGSATPTGLGLNSGSDASRDSSGGSDGNTAHSRPRDGQPIEGHAKPRPGGGSGSGGGVYVPGRYYGYYAPWAYGGFGFAGYYGGVYDPWFYGDPYAYGGSNEGALRLKVSPRDATVMVDGYFAGQVDDFDGVFQSLKLEPGPHRIEIGADGYEALTFEIRVLPDRTLTYKGELKHTP